MSNLKSLRIVFLCIVSVFLVSCGSNKPMVNDVKVSTSVDGQDVMLSLTADLGIGNLQLPNASLPIILPKDGREIGQVSLSGVLGGKNILSIDINVSETANLEFASARLPNGAMIPLIADNSVLKIPVDNVVVYLSLLEGAQAIGVAVPIKSFDKAGRKVGTTTLMPVFSKNGNLGAAGIFTSKTSGQNGIAVVTDISGKIENLLNQSNARVAQMEQADSGSLDFRSHSVSKSKKKRIDREMYKLHRKRTKLKLH